MGSFVRDVYRRRAREQEAERGVQSDELVPNWISRALASRSVQKTHPCDLAKQTCEGDCSMPSQSLNQARMAAGNSQP